MRAANRTGLAPPPRTPCAFARAHNMASCQLPQHRLCRHAGGGCTARRPAPPAPSAQTCAHTRSALRTRPLQPAQAAAERSATSGCSRRRAADTPPAAPALGASTSSFAGLLAHLTQAQQVVGACMQRLPTPRRPCPRSAAQRRTSPRFCVCLRAAGRDSWEALLAQVQTPDDAEACLALMLADAQRRTKSAWDWETDGYGRLVLTLVEVREVLHQRDLLGAARVAGFTQAIPCLLLAQAAARAGVMDMACRLVQQHAPALHLNTGSKDLIPGMMRRMVAAGTARSDDLQPLFALERQLRGAGR